jgi:hypothetical protein
MVELLISTESQEELDLISNVLVEAEEEGQLDFSFTVSRNNLTHKVLQEFINDVEAVGISEVQEIWPDILVTYRKAKVLMKETV